MKWIYRDRQKACQKDIEQESSQLQLLEDQLAQKNAARQSKEQILVKLDDDIRLNQQKLASRDMGNLSPAEIQEKKDLQAQLNRQKVCIITCSIPQETGIRTTQVRQW